MTSVDFMTTSTASPALSFISSALRRVITLSISFSPTSTTTCAIIDPNCTSLTLPRKLIDARKVPWLIEYLRGVTYNRQLIILLFGPPGCGKGTQGRMIIDWLKVKIPCISTGDMFRAEMAAKDAARHGSAVRSSPRAALSPDDLVNKMLCSRISQPDCIHGFMLDGYPRTVEQAEYLDGLVAARGLPSPVIIHLDVPADVLVGRMVSRRQCSKCGQMYNILSKRPKVPGQCDDDGAPLIARKDDREDVIRERLRTYEDVTRPILSHYPSDRYFQISGDRSSTYIFEEITHILESVMAKDGRGESRP